MLKTAIGQRVENNFYQSVQNPVEKKKTKKKDNWKALCAKAQKQKTGKAIAKLFALNANAINCYDQLRKLDARTLMVLFEFLVE